MPNLQNAKKALRQSRKRAARNKIVRDEIHSLRRHLSTALKNKDQAVQKKFVTLLQQKLDKAAKRNIFKENKVNRLKSRMAKAVKKALSAT
jgi:small subunit ribosomal protein S20